MKPKEAWQYIGRQFREGRASKDGITTVHATLHVTSHERMKEAVEAVGGNIWRTRTFWRRDPIGFKPVEPGKHWWKEPKKFYEVTAFVPDRTNPKLDYVPPR